MAFGQQNFFNIPSGQITEYKKNFYQHQLNIMATDSIASKQHFVRGIGKSTEVGLNFLNFYPTGKKEKDKETISGPEVNILAPTFQHSFTLDKRWAINVGSQMGLSHIGGGQPKYVTGKTYGIVSFYNELNHLRLTGGNWVSGTRFNGPGDYYGVLAGVEWMFADGMYIMGDWVSGDTKNSVSVIGGMFDVVPGLQLCVGYLIPNPRSKEVHGMVLEFNIFSL